MQQNAESQNVQEEIAKFLNAFQFQLTQRESSGLFTQKDKQDFGKDYDWSMPFFALGVSSVSGENLESLRFLLYSCLKDFDAQK